MNLDNIFSSRWSRHLAVLLMVWTLISGVYVFSRGPLPKSSGDVRALMPLESKELRDLESMEQTFGDSVFDSIVLSLPGTLESDLEERLEDFSQELSALKGVLRVFSPAQSYSRFSYPLRLRDTKSGLGRFLIEISSALNDEERLELDRELDSLLAKISDLQPLRSGVFSVSEAATKAVEKENRRWTPLCFAALLIVLSILLRDVRACFCVLFPALSSLAWMLSAMLFLDLRLSPVSELSLPLLLVVSASYSMFVLARLVSARANGDPLALKGLVQGLFLAALTTVAGFLSLLPLDVRGVVQFGVIMSIGTTLAALSALFLTPIFLTKSPEELQKVDRSLGRFSWDLRPFVTARILMLSLALALGFACGIPRIVVDSSPLDFLPENTEAGKSFRKVNALFPGTHVLALVLTAAESSDGFNVEQVRLIGAAANKLRQLPGVAWTVSPANFLEFYEQLKAADLEPPDGNSLGPASILSEDHKSLRIIVETDFEGSELLSFNQKALSLLEAELGGKLGEGVHFSSASRELVMAKSSTELTHGLLFSVLSALGLVGLLLFLVFRSWSFALIGLIPSLLPVAAVLGGLAYFSETVNLGASMVAAVALGMVSDNTFHYTLALRACGEYLDAEAAREKAFKLTLSAFVSTALVLVLSFSPTMLSNLSPVWQFGLFLGLSMFLGLISNAVLLPVLLSKYFKHLGKTSELNNDTVLTN